MGKVNDNIYIKVQFFFWTVSWLSSSLGMSPSLSCGRRTFAGALMSDGGPCEEKKGACQQFSQQSYGHILASRLLPAQLSRATGGACSESRPCWVWWGQGEWALKPSVVWFYRLLRQPAGSGLFFGLQSRAKKLEAINLPHSMSFGKFKILTLIGWINIM